MKTPTTPQPSIWRADYVDHAGINRRAHVRVLTTIAEDGTGRTVFYAYHPMKLGCGKNADTPAAAVGRLINDHGWLTSCRAMPGTLADLQADCSRAYQLAHRESVRACGRRGFHRSRGRWVVIIGANDTIVGNGEWEWHGTAKQLAEVMRYAFSPDVTGIYIEGGLDFAETMQDMTDGFYDPWTAQWTVPLYEAGIGTLPEEA